MPRTVTNATAVYTIMMLLFATGMWAILALGSTIRPQPDLAGEWQLAPEGDPRQDTLQASLEQSGKFVRLRVDKRTLDLRIVPRETTPDRITLHATSASAIFEKTLVPDVYRLTLQTSEDGTRRFTARAVTRAYPHATGAAALQRQKSKQSSKATRPAATP